MVSVMGSLLTHTLWRAVGGDPTPRPDLAPPRTAALDECVSCHIEGYTLQDLPGRRCDQTCCWRRNAESGREVHRGSDADTREQRPHVHHLPTEADAGVGDATGAWVLLDTHTSSASSDVASPSCSASWSARTCTVSLPVGGAVPSAPSPPETPLAAREWWDGCLAPPQDQGHDPAQLSSPSLLDLCASTYQGLSQARGLDLSCELGSDVAKDSTCPADGCLAVCANSGQDLTSRDKNEALARSQVDQEVTCDQPYLERTCSQVEQEVNNPRVDQGITRPLVNQNVISSNADHELSRWETARLTCPILSPSLRGRSSHKSVLGSREVATPGSPGSGADEQRWRRQYVRRSRSEDSSCSLRRPCAASRSAYTMNSNTAHSVTSDVRATEPPIPQDDRALLPTEPPRLVQDGDSSDATPTKTSLGVMGSGRLRRDIVGYREDIRDFDIYKITPPVGEGQYPRLPPLPTQSDSDTDEEAGRYEGLRKRKRRKVEQRDAGERKRYREEEEEEDVTMALEATTLLLPSAIELHQNFNTITVSPTRTVPRPSPSSTAEVTSRPPPSPATTTSVSTSTEEKREEVEDVASDDTMSDENEDDDEASTVVPEDFGDDSDSDIEVLIQSGKFCCRCCCRQWR